MCVPPNNGTDTNPYISTGVTATQVGHADEWQYSPTPPYQSLALFQTPTATPGCSRRSRHPERATISRRA